MLMEALAVSPPSEISESLEAPTGVGLLRSSLSLSIADPLVLEPLVLLSAKFIKTYKNKKDIYF